MASITANDASRNPFTITRYILQEQKKYPNAKGDLTIILNSVTLAVKIIAAAATGAGIFQRYGVERLKNETLTKLPTDPKEEKESKETEQGSKDESIRDFAYDSILSSIAWCGKVPMMLSTLDASTPINVKPCETPKYILVFDPVDGKQNIEINASLGTIFGIYRVQDPSKPTPSDCLQSGSELVCAGYALYGDATVVMISFGEEVHGFTLDPTIGEFVLTHKNVKIPETGSVYSINEGYAEEWDDAIKAYIALCKKPLDKSPSMKSRYSGCMVQDVHRCLIRGGIFLYPVTKKFPHGKLNLQCECNPLAFIVKAAGGRASDGKIPIENIKVKASDQTTPIFIGSANDVKAVESCYANIK